MMFFQALLDMLVSFADLSALSNETYSRPTVCSSEASLVIKSGRHPVVSQNRSQAYGATFIPNDLFMNASQRFVVVTGANGAGKVN